MTHTPHGKIPEGHTTKGIGGIGIGLIALATQRDEQMRQTPRL